MPQSYGLNEFADSSSQYAALFNRMRAKSSKYYLRLGSLGLDINSTTLAHSRLTNIGPQFIKHLANEGKSFKRYAIAHPVQLMNAVTVYTDACLRPLTSRTHLFAKLSCDFYSHCPGCVSL